MRDWFRSMADKALQKVESQPRAPRRGNREKELFAIRAREVKGLFQRLEALAQAINKEAASTLISAQRSISAKNLGGIEVPDGARLVLKFLDRRLEVVVNALQSVGGRPVPIGGLAFCCATASPKAVTRVKATRSCPSVTAEAFIIRVAMFLRIR